MLCRTQFHCHTVEGDRPEVSSSEEFISAVQLSCRPLFLYTQFLIDESANTDQVTR